MATNEQNLADLIRKDKPSMTVEEYKAFLQTATTETNASSLESIAKSQHNLIQVKESLGAIIDGLHENPSIFSKAASMWGELTTVQKVLSGVGVVGPTVIAGCALHIGVLVALGGMSLATGLVLEDHQVHAREIATKLKEGVLSIADILQTTINALDNIHKKFEVELCRFRDENDALKQSINTLNASISSLGESLKICIDTEKHLRDLREQLTQQMASIQNDLVEQERISTELNAVARDYAANQVTLNKRISELGLERLSMTSEIKQLKLTTTCLEGILKTLSPVVKSKVSITGVGVDIEPVIAHLSALEAEVTKVRLTLAQTEAGNVDILKKQEEQEAKMEGICSRLGGVASKAQLLGTLGVMARRPSASELPSYESAIQAIPV